MGQGEYMFVYPPPPTGLRQVYSGHREPIGRKMNRILPEGNSGEAVW